jgi:hypothetical protein
VALAEASIGSSLADGLAQADFVSRGGLVGDLLENSFVLRPRDGVSTFHPHQRGSGQGDGEQ